MKFELELGDIIKLKVIKGGNGNEPPQDDKYKLIKISDIIKKLEDTEVINTYKNLNQLNLLRKKESWFKRIINKIKKLWN